MNVYQRSESNNLQRYLVGQKCVINRTNDKLNGCKLLGGGNICCGNSSIVQDQTISKYEEKKDNHQEQQQLKFPFQMKQQIKKKSSNQVNSPLLIDDQFLQYYSEHIINSDQKLKVIESEKQLEEIDDIIMNCIIKYQYSLIQHFEIYSFYFEDIFEVIIQYLITHKTIPEQPQDDILKKLKGTLSYCSQTLIKQYEEYSDIQNIALIVNTLKYYLKSIHKDQQDAVVNSKEQLSTFIKFIIHQTEMNSPSLELELSLSNAYSELQILKNDSECGASLYKIYKELSDFNFETISQENESKEVQLGLKMIAIIWAKKTEILGDKLKFTIIDEMLFYLNIFLQIQNIKEIPDFTILYVLNSIKHCFNKLKCIGEKELSNSEYSQNSFPQIEELSMKNEALKDFFDIQFQKCDQIFKSNILNSKFSKNTTFKLIVVQILLAYTTVFDLREQDDNLQVEKQIFYQDLFYMYYSTDIKCILKAFQQNKEFRHLEYQISKFQQDQLLEMLKLEQKNRLAQNQNSQNGDKEKQSQHKKSFNRNSIRKQVSNPSYKLSIENLICHLKLSFVLASESYLLSFALLNFQVDLANEYKELKTQILNLSFEIYFYNQTQDNSKWEGIIKQLLEKYPSHYQSYIVYGDYLRQTNDIKKSFEQYVIALQFKKDMTEDEEIYKKIDNLFIFYDDLKALKKQWYLDLLNKYPDYPQALFILGNCCEIEGNLKKALIYYKKANKTEYYKRCSLQMQLGETVYSRQHKYEKCLSGFYNFKKYL